jgi:hypothetical protein
MPVEINDDGALVQPTGSQREQELEAKLNRRTMWAGLFAFIAVTELIIMVEVVRQAS